MSRVLIEEGFVNGVFY